MAIADLVTAANGGVPTNRLKPNNCHEAALGWVLMAKYPTLRVPDALSQGQPKAWLALRSLAERYGAAGTTKQLTGQWFGTNLYNQQAVRVFPHHPAPGAPPIPLRLGVGDVVFMGNPAAPHHSMIVVQKVGVAPRETILARGFNNAGAFGGPYMDWDPTLRDLADPTRWAANGDFMGNNGGGPLHKVSYATICTRIPDNLNF